MLSVQRTSDKTPVDRVPNNTYLCVYYITQYEKPGVFAVKNMTLAGAGILSVRTHIRGILYCI